MLNSTDKIIKHKTGLLNLAEELGNVSRACQVMGYSRDTFYRYKSAVNEGGVQALLERTRRKPNMANRVDELTEQAVLQSAIDFPAYGQARTSNELRKLGVFVSPSGVRSIWLRIISAPHELRFVAPKGVTSDKAMKQLTTEFPYPAVPFGTGLITFATLPDFEDHFTEVGAFETLGVITRWSCLLIRLQHSISSFL